MEFTERKSNRLREYDYSTNGAYFVTVCTFERQNTLSHLVGDGFPVPTPFGTIAEAFIQQIPVKYPSVSVEKYVIMPDHIHLLLLFDHSFGTGNPSPTLGNVMGWYKYQVTKQANASLGQDAKPRFQRSYYDHVIRNQADYDQIWQYIENNPRKRILERRGEL